MQYHYTYFIPRFKNYFSKIIFLFVFIFFLFNPQGKAIVNDTMPNIILIISDDIGVDLHNGYHQGNLMPTTPTLDSLRSVGIMFENVWAAPVCTPTRSAIMTGKFGAKTGVLGVPGTLDLSHTTLFQELENQTNGGYSDALIGKHHLGGNMNTNHPIDLGADIYTGFLGGAVQDYYAWPKTENGVTATAFNYVTSDLTNSAIDWIDQQSQQDDEPWFLWLAHGAAHTPVHLPPSEMYSIQNTATNFRKYIAMIESIDYEINRLLYAMPDSVRENTMIIYVGDNGTPGAFTQDYPAGSRKGSVYQGGIRVPLIIAGAGVNRQGVRESALIHVTDLYATILEIAGAELPGGLYNSLSFNHLLKDEPGATRDYNYSEIGTINNGITAWAARTEEYKLIQYVDSTQEFYNLLEDSLELNDLMLGTLDANQLAIVTDLEAEALQIQTDWSCRDHIQNGDEEGIDCGGSHCASCTTNTAEISVSTNAFKLYPNPANELLNIESKNDQIEEVKIYNSVGKLLISKSSINAKNMELSINTLPPQIYFVHIKTKEEQEVLRFLKL